MGSGFVLRRVYNIVSTALAVGAMLLLIAFAGVRLVGLTPYAVLSGSMEPVYPVGSLIYVQDVEPESVAVGDAITFSLDSGTLVTHEVWDIDESGKQFFTQGIANHDANGDILHDAAPVPFARLVGKPMLCIPFLGYLNAFFTSPTGVFTIIAIVAAMAAASFAITLVEERRQTPART